MSSVNDLAEVTFLHKFFIILGQVTQCMLLLWQRKEALRGKWKHQSFLRPQAFLPHFIGQSKSHGPIQLHASPMEADGGEVINIYWMINLTYDTTPFLSLASSFPTGSRTPAKSLQEVPFLLQLARASFCCLKPKTLTDWSTGGSLSQMGEKVESQDAAVRLGEEALGD